MDGCVEAHTPSFAWRVSLPFSASTRMTDSEYAQAEDSDRHGQRCTTAHARADPPPSLHTHAHNAQCFTGSRKQRHKSLPRFLSCVSSMCFFFVFPALDCWATHTHTTPPASLSFLILLPHTSSRSCCRHTHSLPAPLWSPSPFIYPSRSILAH